MTETSLDTHYRWAISYLRALIQAPPGPPPSTPPEVVRVRAQRRLERLRGFLEFLGQPQSAYPVVHVTGTSGKGSTATFIASILHAHGYRVGLHTSPYLQVESEKIQIGQTLISADHFAQYVAELDEAVRCWIARGDQPLTYGEFWTALTFYAFKQEAIDIAVVEVGVGGRFDLTNVVYPEVAVITTVGLDHIRTIGPTLADIAWHKAGIIKPGRPAVTGVSDPTLLAILLQEATSVGATLETIQYGRDYEAEVVGERLQVHDHRTGHTFRLGLAGTFQALNAALAISAIRWLGHLPRGPVPAGVVAQGLATARVPGRFEIVQREPLVILDGAHNPQKMQAFLSALQELPCAGQRIVIFGVLDGHDAEEMAALLAPHTDMIITTTPHAILRQPANPDQLADAFRRSGIPALTVPKVEDAMQHAFTLASPHDHVVVTGSLYLVGQAREYWYPSTAIVQQQTCWPILVRKAQSGAGAACSQ